MLSSTRIIHNFPPRTPLINARYHFSHPTHHQPYHRPFIYLSSIRKYPARSQPTKRNQTPISIQTSLLRKVTPHQSRSLLTQLHITLPLIPFIHIPTRKFPPHENPHRRPNIRDQKPALEPSFHKARLQRTSQCFAHHTLHL